MGERITFVVPAYNAGKTIKRTVNSILGQTDTAWRAILVDDGSTDDTPAIIRDYEARYPEKICGLHEPNAGQGAARNLGMRYVETDYISFLDSDDWLMPDYVETIVRQLDSRTVQPDIILTLPVIYDETSHRVRDWYDRKIFEQTFPLDGDITAAAEAPQLYGMEVNVCRKVLRTGYVRKLGFGFREHSKWEDVCPHFYLLSHAESCMGIGSTGFYYRVGRAAQTTASRGQDRMDIIPVLKELSGILEKEKRREMLFPAMRIMVRFSVWCIRMTDGELRRELVSRLHDMYRHLPRDYYRELKKGLSGYSKADAGQYRLFLTAIRHKSLNFILKDYLLQETGERIIKKLLHAGRRVA